MRNNHYIRYNTLDIDADPEGKKLKKALIRIRRCRHAVKHEFTRSTSGVGWHVKIYCNTDCDMCRKLFDDPVRYERDKRRPISAQNVLHSRKYLTVRLPLGIIIMFPWPRPVKAWLKLRKARKSELLENLSLPSET